MQQHLKLNNGSAINCAWRMSHVQAGTSVALTTPSTGSACLTSLHTGLGVLEFGCIHSAASSYCTPKSFVVWADTLSQPLVRPGGVVGHSPWLFAADLTGVRIEKITGGFKGRWDPDTQQ